MNIPKDLLSRQLLLQITQSFESENQFRYVQNGSKDKPTIIKSSVLPNFLLKDIPLKAKLVIIQHDKVNSVTTEG